MQADLFNCSLCSESFDLQLHTPKILISCPHCFCLKCLNDIFINHPLPQERQCPTCSLSFFSTIKTPEDLPTDPTLIYLLQSQPKTNIKKDAKPDFHPQRNEREGLFLDKTHKKLKTEKESDNELGDLNKLIIINQFIGMRKFLSPSPQNIESPLKVQSETFPETDLPKTTISEITTAAKSSDETESVIIEEKPPKYSLAKISKKLQEILDETQQTIDRLSKTNGNQTNGILTPQIPQENSLASEIEEEAKIKPLSPLETNTPDILQEADPPSENEEEVKIKPLSPLETNIPYVLQEADPASGSEREEEEEIESMPLSPIETNLSSLLHYSDSASENEEEEVQIKHLSPLETNIPYILQEADPASESEQEEQEEVKIMPLSPLETKSDYILEYSDDEDCFTFKLKRMNKGGDAIEEELAEEEEEEKLTQQPEIQESPPTIMEIETECKLKFDFSEKVISDEIFDNISSQDFWNKTDRLEVNFSSSSLTDQLFIKFIQDFLTKMENLTTLILNLANTKISSQSLQTLSGQFLKNHKLQSFILNCSGASIGYEAIKSLDDELSFSFKTLENIELIFDSTDIQGEKFLYSLIGMNQLKRLKLSFDSSEIWPEMASSIVTCLRFVENLESLDLNFNDTDIGDKSLFVFSISHMTRLKHLKLCLGGTFVSNDFLLNFFQNLNQLETLELDLHCTEFSNTALLNHMQNLEILTLDLRQTKITDESLQTLRIPTHKLKSLTLNLSENKIHDSGLQAFKEINNFMNIKRINLQVRQTEVTNEALQDFLNLVKKVKKESKEERNVFSELKKELSLFYGFKKDPQRIETLRLSKMIKKLKPKTYENILREVLARILPTPILVINIEEWKKTIQSMINIRLEKIPQKAEEKIHEKQNKFSIENENQELSEFVLSCRWLKKYGQEISFREKVIEILKNKEIRTFRVFYLELLGFLRELSKSTYKSWKMSAKLRKDPKFPKNWWSRYMKKDQEITNLWKNLLHIHKNISREEVNIS